MNWRDYANTTAPTPTKKKRHAAASAKPPAPPIPPLSEPTPRRSRGRVHIPGQMNKTEARYAQHLELRKQVGEIQWYGFECIKLKLAASTHYTPDFLVLDNDGWLQCHEVKATEQRRSQKGIDYHRARAEDDARVKVKVAAAMFPIAFFIVYRDKQSGWILEEK